MTVKNGGNAAEDEVDLNSDGSVSLPEGCKIKPNAGGSVKEKEDDLI